MNQQKHETDVVIQLHDRILERNIAFSAFLYMLYIIQVKKKTNISKRGHDYNQALICLQKTQGGRITSESCDDKENIIPLVCIYFLLIKLIEKVYSWKTRHHNISMEERKNEMFFFSLNKCKQEMKTDKQTIARFVG